VRDLLAKIKNRCKDSPSFWQSLANYAEKGWGLLFSVSLARLIFPESFGIFALGLSIAFLVVFPCRWEIGSLVRVDPYYRNEGFEAVWGLTKRLVIIECLLIMVTAAVAYWGYHVFEVSMVILFWGLGAAMDRFGLILKCDLEGEMQFKQNFYTRLLNPIIVMVVIFPLALAGYGLTALVSGSLAGVVVNWVIIRRFNKRSLLSHRKGTAAFKKLIRSSFWLWLNQLGAALLSKGDKIILGSSCSHASVASYNRAYNFSPISLMVLGGLTGAPATVEIARAESRGMQLKIYLRRCIPIVLAGLMNGVVWWLFADKLVPFIFGERWIYAIPSFRIFAFLASLQGFYLMSHALLSGRKEYRELAIIKLASVLIACMAVLAMGPSIWSVALGVQGAMLLAGVLCVLYFFMGASKKDRSENKEVQTHVTE